MHQLADNQAILTVSTPDLDWMLDTFPETWECTPLQAATDDYLPKIILPARQVLGAEIQGVQVSVTGGLDAVEAMRRVFQEVGTINGKRCHGGYALIVTVQDAEAQTPRVRRIHMAIARSQSSLHGEDEQLCFL